MVGFLKNCFLMSNFFFYFHALVCPLDSKIRTLAKDVALNRIWPLCVCTYRGFSLQSFPRFVPNHWQLFWAFGGGVGNGGLRFKLKPLMSI